MFELEYESKKSARLESNRRPFDDYINYSQMLYHWAKSGANNYKFINDEINMILIILWYNQLLILIKQ